MHQIRFAQSEKEIAACWEVVSTLRPHLEKDRYVEQVKEMQQEGYQMLYLSEKDTVAAFAGYRNLHSLFASKFIYVDDLCTLPAFRGRGYAGALLDYVLELAKETGKTSVVLDSGFQLHDAHRLYLNKGYVLSAHHFRLSI
jgi:GNAT superfamily N-acetyltransferase